MIIRSIKRLFREQEGATAIEFAVALPVLIVMLWAILQFGLVFRAAAGIQHSLGEGARVATLYPRPTVDVIRAKMNAAVYGVGPGTFTIPDPTVTTTTVNLTVTYTQPTDLIIFPGPTVTMTRSKLVYTVTD
jgi:Flp pilus assembly protein TadG